MANERYSWGTEDIITERHRSGEGLKISSVIFDKICQQIWNNSRHQRKQFK